MVLVRVVRRVGRQLLGVELNVGDPECVGDRRVELQWHVGIQSVVDDGCGLGEVVGQDLGLDEGGDDEDLVRITSDLACTCHQISGRSRLVEAADECPDDVLRRLIPDEVVRGGEEEPLQTPPGPFGKAHVGRVLRHLLELLDRDAGDLRGDRERLVESQAFRQDESVLGAGLRREHQGQCVRSTHLLTQCVGPRSQRRRTRIIPRRLDERIGCQDDAGLLQGATDLGQAVATADDDRDLTGPGPGIVGRG